MKVLVTGASGFVGRRLVTRLARDGTQVIAAARRRPSDLPASCRFVELSELGNGDPPLSEHCEVDVVVHTAARVHVMHEDAMNPLALFRSMNVDGSVAIAREAFAAGARRLVFLSSLKVLGEFTLPGRPFTESSPVAPFDAYARSKAEAERALAECCDSLGMELVIIRAPLVYGPGVKANFERLMRAVAQKRPLPFGRLTGNRRSLVALDNLVDLICACISSEAAAGQAFLVSDGEDLSTAELVKRLATALCVAPNLWPIPAWLLPIAGTLANRRDAAQRLCGSLQVDMRHTTNALSWLPPVGVDEAMKRAVAPLQTRYAG